MSYRIKDYLEKEVATINVGASILEASKLMMKKDVGYLVVLERDQPVGMVTERDLVMKVIAKEKNPSTVKVSEIMSSPLITVNLDATIEDAVKAMAKHRIRRLPVVKDNVICGIFTTRDLTKHFNEYADRIARDISNMQSIYGRSVNLEF